MHIIYRLYLPDNDILYYRVLISPLFPRSPFVNGSSYSSIPGQQQKQIKNAKKLFLKERRFWIGGPFPFVSFDKNN